MSRTLLFLLVISCIHLTRPTYATSTANISNLFPRNLRRLYDGTWESSPNRLPFANIPPSPDARLTGIHNGSHALSVTTRREPTAEEFSFRKRSGFALLSAENHRSELSDAVDIVFGELLLRDGTYRTSRDVSLKVIGVYEWASGTVVVVGDMLFDDTRSSLQRLYAEYAKARPQSMQQQNFTEQVFIEALSPRFTKHRKDFRAQRPGSPRHTGVAAQCPFSASFEIAPGNYNDRPPKETEFTTVSGLPPRAGAGQVVSGSAAGAVVLDSTRDALVPNERVGGWFGRGDVPDETGLQEEDVAMKGTFTSDACDTELTIALTTLDTEILFGKAINYTLLVTVVAFAQVIVLIRQMEMTSTQAGARRVSLMTVGLQAVADSYLCLGHLTMGIAVDTLFNAFATAAFFKFICFSIFLMRWMLLIWKARRPSGFSEGWEAMRRELSMLYSRFYGSLLLGILLLYQLQNHMRFFLFALYSFWLPQIVLNVVEDHRRPLLPMYILGTSLTRLAIPLYFLGCPQNFLHIQPQPGSAMGLVIWLMSQAIVLLTQYKFGPRWFIPKAFLPEKYDYYRPVTLEDEEVVDLEAGEGVTREDAGEQRHLNSSGEDPKRECCICMESVSIHSRERMVTPCNHFFHATCLERWLEVRLECALCRSPVPPP